jgi:two-component system, cell cycle response regulator
MTALPSLTSITDDGHAPAVWARPDPALAAAGMEGEFVVARVRVIAMGLLILAPTWSLIQQPHEPQHLTGFIVTLFASFVAVGIWWMLRRGNGQPWVPLASSAFDVSMVTLALITFLIVASPMNALNSTVTFEMYFLAILATSLRYDARICIVIGLLAIVEFSAVWLFASLHYDLHAASDIGAAGPYSPVDTATRLILLGVATILAVTLVQRAQRLLYLASRDRLTGLFNRGHFDRALAAATDTAARDGRPLALALLDIDHFKQINDAHGHELGDTALRKVAELLATAMRRTDIVARYGGEEFIVLMPNTTSILALARIELLRQEVAATPIDLGGDELLQINFSAGVAGIPDDALALSAKHLVSVADQRLLAAKRRGRGRCIGTDDAAPDVPTMDSGVQAPGVAMQP